MATNFFVQYPPNINIAVLDKKTLEDSDIKEILLQITASISEIALALNMLSQNGLQVPSENGELLIGSTGNPAVLKTLVAGAGVTIVNGADGTITISSP